MQVRSEAAQGHKEIHEFRILLPSCTTSVMWCGGKTQNLQISGSCTWMHFRFDAVCGATHRSMTSRFYSCRTPLHLCEMAVKHGICGSLLAQMDAGQRPDRVRALAAIHEFCVLLPSRTTSVLGDGRKTRNSRMSVGWGGCRSCLTRGRHISLIKAEVSVCPTIQAPY